MFVLYNFKDKFRRYFIKDTIHTILFLNIYVTVFTKIFDTGKTSASILLTYAFNFLQISVRYSHEREYITIYPSFPCHFPNFIIDFVQVFTEKNLIYFNSISSPDKTACNTCDGGSNGIHS